MKKYILAAIAVFAAAVPVGAADIGGSIKDTFSNAPAIQTVGRTGFGGGYVGASVNWSNLEVDHRGSVDWSSCDDCPMNDEYQRISDKLPGMSDDEFTGGIQAGYNFTAGAVYFGPVVKFDLGGPSATLRRTLIENPEGDFLDTTGKIEMDVNWTATLAAKLGVQVADWLGVYGLIGVGFVDVDARGGLHVNLQPMTVQGVSLHTQNHSDTITALTYGLGVDVKLTERWRAFAEYQRFDLETFNAGGSFVLDCIEYGYAANADLDVVRVGLNVAF